MKTLLEGGQSEGEHVAVWDGSAEDGEQVASGLYFVRLLTREWTDVRKVVLVR